MIQGNFGFPLYASTNYSPGATGATFGPSSTMAPISTILVTHESPFLCAHVFFSRAPMLVCYRTYRYCTVKCGIFILKPVLQYMVKT